MRNLTASLSYTIRIILELTGNKQLFYFVFDKLSILDKGQDKVVGFRHINQAESVLQ